jgi:hypothetical protein
MRNAIMNPKLLLCLALVLSGGLFGCSTVSRDSSAVSPAAEQILRRTSDYYQNLGGFEGTNTIIDQSPTFKMARTKQFVFLRPNKFLIRPSDTNDSQLFCDGTNVYDYRPYYFNSYSKTPAPARFENAITNWIGGELLHLIVSADRFRYITNGFGWGMMAMKNEGEETVDGVTCHHLLMEESGARTDELWIAAGDSPFILKYVSRFPATAPAKGAWAHTEIISGWKANETIPFMKFAFVPPAGAIEHPPNEDQAELSVTLTNGVEKREAEFTAGNEASDTGTFLKQNRERFQAVALKAILAKYAELTTNDLAFSNIEPASPNTAEKTFVATFALPKTAETTNVNQSVETKQQVVIVTLRPDGTVKSVSRGNSFSLHSLNQTKP